MTVLEDAKKSRRGSHKKRDHTNPNPRVRLAAVEKLEDPEILVEVACTDDSPRVRLTAVGRLAGAPTNRLRNREVLMASPRPGVSFWLST